MGVSLVTNRDIKRLRRLSAEGCPTKAEAARRAGLSRWAVEYWSDRCHIEYPHPSVSDTLQACHEREKSAHEKLAREKLANTMRRLQSPI